MKSTFGRNGSINKVKSIMCAQLLKRAYLHHVIDCLNAVRSQKDDSVSYAGFEYLWYASAIQTAVQFRNEIPRSAIPKIVSQALNAPTKNGKLSHDKLEKKLKELEMDYLKKPETMFLLRGYLSVRGIPPFRHLKLDGAQFDFMPRRRLEPIPENDIRNPPFHGNVPENYHPVIVKVRASTSSDAAHKAIDQIDLVRGFWNFLINKSFRMSFGPRKPVNEITSGPVYTLHNVDGTLRDNGVWHEETVFVGARLRDLEKERDNLRKKTLVFQRCLASSAFSDEIRDAVIRYARALDRIDYEHSVIELWSILETLTRTSEHNAVVSRAASIYRNREEARAVINHIRIRRNEIVHRTRSFDDAESLVFQTKGIVEGLLAKYIGMFSRYFSTKAEIETFLDMPRDRRMLSIGGNFIQNG